LLERIKRILLLSCFGFFLFPFFVFGAFCSECIGKKTLPNENDKMGEMVNRKKNSPDN